MTVHRLRNEAWGFRSNCFVCEPSNPAGLRLEFHHDDDADTVTTEFTLSEEFSGAPKFVHGGLSLAILDELHAWAAIAVAGKFAVTAETTAQFCRPVKLDRTYRAVARITGRDEDHITSQAEIFDRFDHVCVESTARLKVLSEIGAAVAIGAELDEDTARRYLRGRKV